MQCRVRPSTLTERSPWSLAISSRFLSAQCILEHRQGAGQELHCCPQRHRSAANVNTRSGWSRRSVEAMSNSLSEAARAAMNSQTRTTFEDTRLAARRPAWMRGLLTESGSPASRSRGGGAAPDAQAVASGNDQGMLNPDVRPGCPRCRHGFRTGLPRAPHVPAAHAGGHVGVNRGRFGHHAASSELGAVDFIGKPRADTGQHGGLRRGAGG